MWAKFVKLIAESFRQSYNAIREPHRYAVQGSDTTMMTIAASLSGQ